MKFLLIQYLLISSLLFFCNTSLAQDIIKGTVIDHRSQDMLPGANIFWTDKPGKGAVSDLDGNFEIPVTELPAVLRITYVGFDTITREISSKDLGKELKFFLKASELSLDEVIVSEVREDQNVMGLEMGKSSLPVATLKNIPALFGEVDLLRGLQLLPGVQTAGEGTTGLFVRGGSSDQNLLQIDGAPVYNPSHFFGFFSVFNPDALENVEMYKGNIPAQYGGRLSSLIDVSLKEGNTQKIKGEGGIGSISSRLTVDGPLFSDQSSFVISGRRTYADVFLGLSSDENIRNNSLYFYDLSGKLMFRPGDKDKITFSSYFGNDYLGLSEQFGFGWSNWVSSLVWKRNIHANAFLDLSAYHTFYNYNLSFADEDIGFDWGSDLAETGVRAELVLTPSERTKWNLGAHTQVYHFAPIDLEAAENSGIESINTNPRTGFQNNLFAAVTMDFHPRWSVETGLRWSLYNQVGRGVNYVYEEDSPGVGENITDTLHYSRFQNMKFYQGLEPRFAFRYLIRTNLSLKGAYNRNFQYVQVASNSSAGLPIDRWVPAGRYIDPIRSDQVSLGLFQNIKDNQWEISLEAYYKDFDNIIDLKQGADVLFNDNVETEILSGIGWAYGLEFLIRKKMGQTNGWLGYTYSRAFRKIEGISEGLTYNPRFDRPHDVTLILNHQFNNRISASATFVYTTGVAVTFPIGNYMVDNQKVPLYGPRRNEDRFPDYHRMDASVIIKNKDKGRKWKGSWNISVYNLYGRKNPFSYQFQDIVNDDINFAGSSGEEIFNKRPGVVMTYLFSVLPSVTYNFEF